MNRFFVFFKTIPRHFEGDKNYKDSLQMYANVKLGCSPNYDSFEANF